jgi:hypothetical protein
MPRRVCIVAVLLGSCLQGWSQNAAAWPVRRRAVGNYGGGGAVQVAPKIDAESAEYRPLNVVYNYDKAVTREVAFADRVRVFMDIHDPDVLKANQPLVAEVRLADMSNSQATYVKWCPVSLTRDAKENVQVGVIDITNARRESLLRPAHVYRLFINLHRQAPKYGQATVRGRVPGPYYVATSGRTLLQRARHRIVMRTFREWYYTERGWRSGENYPMDCHAYYCWAVGKTTTSDGNGWANPGLLFGGNVPYRSGGDIPELAAKGSIHGDYVRVPGHTFMLLAYDEKLGQVWTMEGNFNRSIEIALRPVGPGWTVGPLQEEHMRPEAVGS